LSSIKSELLTSLGISKVQSYSQCSHSIILSSFDANPKKLTEFNILI